ncbi:MAG: hypothetical protein LBD48_06435 [Treponema sp.]|jgi:hypothetical protein|nr:hypothetical protein [Treponema sp.]
MAKKTFGLGGFAQEFGTLCGVIFLAAAVALVMAGCGGGGNISTVKNGVFEGFDSTITVGKALENNSLLQGGKYAAVEMDGRDYVTYTVKFTAAQVMEHSDPDYRMYLHEDKAASGGAGKPNFSLARFFYYKMGRWGSLSDSVLADTTTMSKEEIREARDILDPIVNTKAPELEDFFNFRIYIVNGRGDFLSAAEGGRYGSFNLEYADPYLDTVVDKVTRTGWNGEPIQAEEQHIKGYIRNIVGATTYVEWGDWREPYTDNGVLTGPCAELFVGNFGDTNYADNTEFIQALARTRNNLYNARIKATEDLEQAKAEYERWKTTEIDPQLTIDGAELVLSFVMNTDGTFTTNMIEVYTEVTLKCMNNLKVRYLVGTIKGQNTILDQIYKGDKSIIRLILF